MTDSTCKFEHDWREPDFLNLKGEERVDAMWRWILGVQKETIDEMLAVAKKDIADGNVTLEEVKRGAHFYIASRKGVMRNRLEWLYENAKDFPKEQFAELLGKR